MSRRKKRPRFGDRIIEIIIMCIIVDLGILSIYHTAISIYHVQSNDLNMDISIGDDCYC